MRPKQLLMVALSIKPVVCSKNDVCLSTFDGYFMLIIFRTLDIWCKVVPLASESLVFWISLRRPQMPPIDTEQSHLHKPGRNCSEFSRQKELTARLYNSHASDCCVCHPRPLGLAASKHLQSNGSNCASARSGYIPRQLMPVQLMRHSAA